MLRTINCKDIKTANISPSSLSVAFVLELDLPDGETEKLKYRVDLSLSEELQKILLDRGVDITLSSPSLWRSILILLPSLMIMGFMGTMMYRSMNPKRSATKKPTTSSVMMEDVGGLGPAKEEAIDLIETLKNPQTRKKAAKGVLLVGPPGTGKTLLAKAIAGESGLPFYKVSGSELLDIFQSGGVLKVKSLFKMAKKNSPCIIFIDEIDAIGKKRDMSGRGNSDEREATLNQLLVEIDGFDENTDVVVIAATNRHQILDDALTRPKRMDLIIHIPEPDLEGRLDILEKVTKNENIDPTVDLKDIAKLTLGMTGAGIVSMLEQASIKALKENKPVDLDHFQEAVTRVVAGIETGHILSDKEREQVAWHEAGHTLVSLITDGDSPQMVSIIPRGESLGQTIIVDDEQNSMYSHGFLIAKIENLLAGRIAEECKYKQSEVGSGASGDFSQATKIATQMVLGFGFGDPEKMGSPYRSFIHADGSDAFFPEVNQAKRSAEIDNILNNAGKKVTKMIKAGEGFIKALVEVLLEKETVTKEEIIEIWMSHKVNVGKFGYNGAGSPSGKHVSLSTRKVRT